MDSSISVRELRNNVTAVLRRVEAGERLTVTVERRAVAELIPLRQRRAVPIDEALNVVSRHDADLGLLSNLAGIVPDTTDDA